MLVLARNRILLRAEGVAWVVILEWASAKGCLALLPLTDSRPWTRDTYKWAVEPILTKSCSYDRAAIRPRFLHSVALALAEVVSRHLPSLPVCKLEVEAYKHPRMLTWSSSMDREARGRV